MTNMKFKIFVFWLVGFCVFPRLLSQTYNFRTYSEDQGLPHSYIYCISQSDEGYLYLSTGEGLSIFDGNKFTTFTSKEVAGNFVSTHYIDKRKVIWLGHLQNGISYLKNSKFNEVKNAAIADAKVTQFAEDSNNNLYISTLGSGIFKTDSNYMLKWLAHEKLLNTNSIIIEKDNGLLAATSNGLFSLTVTKDRIQIIGTAVMLDRKNVKQVIRVSGTDNLFWALVEGEGIYGLKRIGNRFEVFTHINKELLSDHMTVSCIYNDKVGNLWVSLFGEGLRKIVFAGRPQLGNFSVFIINKSNGLKNLNIQTIFEDFEGNMWFGTFGGGLIEKPIEKFSFYKINDGLKNIDVGKIAIDSSGNIWIANKEGVCFFDPERLVTTQYNKSNGFIDDEVNTVLFDTDGLLWIGTANNGIYTYDPSTKQFLNLTAKNKLKSLTINDLVQSGEEMVIATDEGIIIYDLKSQNIQIYTTSDGLLHNNLVSVFYDSKHRLWVSSHGSPPYYIAKGKVYPLKHEGLNTFNINAITEDQKQNIWIATDGDGVFKWDGKSVVNYKMNDGLASNYCKGIEVDRNDAVWVSHLSGLSEKKSHRLKFHHVTDSEGLLFPENNLNAIFKDRKGDLWFGTTAGIVHYNAAIGKKSVVEPKLSIVRVSINDKNYLPSSDINVKFGFYNVHITYKAIALINPDKIKYKYRLPMIDSTWSSETHDDFVNYPSLSDGEYAFEVLACNSEGLWTSTPSVVKFTIRKPIWKRAWFYIILLITIVFLTYLIIVWRTRTLKSSQLLLQTKVKQKTFLLQREKEEVEKIKVQLENKNKDITDSINYAKRIQDSLLPPEETLNDLFDDNYFIYYKPKDIVSGDFYWAARVETGGDRPRTLSLAAVADCTGHGVPGAFLSIVANSFLKQSLTEKFVNNTGEVLDYLNKNITATLNPTSKIKNRINDGMDLAIIAIDYRLNKLHYAGANNAIYIFRKDENETKLFILKPTKQAIGSASGNTVRYESQDFDLQAGDTIYMFSDGYADQFGGEKDKKLNYKRFKEILGHASEMPVSLQRAYLEDSFEGWRGTTPQTDDICVMGLKV